MNNVMNHRSCYVNFAEHLQNKWNPNLYYPEAPNQWTEDEWIRFFTMLKAFGYNIFEFWLPPTLFSPEMIKGDPIAIRFIEKMSLIIDTAHNKGLKVKMLCGVNTIGANWYHACPNDLNDRKLILMLWQFWCRTFSDVDFIGIFPGDPGGCNRNGCSYKTFIELALEIAEQAGNTNPAAGLEVNTWGTPFCCWDDDMHLVPGWDGSFAMISDKKYNTPEEPLYIWNGNQDRAKKAMEYFINRLPSFPKETIVAINLGFSPDGDATHGGDARQYAREVAAIRPIVSWDYSVSEGELVNYPHWRLPRMSSRRREEFACAPYQGGMVYTMTPKLNILSLYAGAQFLLNPNANPDDISRQFCSCIFGDEHAVLGELFEAFEVVQGWGHYPRRNWSKPALIKVYTEIIERLEAANMTKCNLPILPDPDEYRKDILWFARKFMDMAGQCPDRNLIKSQYRKYALAIYDYIPKSVDERTEEASDKFSNILL